MKETLVRYVNSFSEHPAFPDLPLGMRITSHEGVRFRWVGYWSFDGSDRPWPPNGARRRYRIDYDPSEESELADWERELLDGADSEPSTLHTIDCHGIDPAIIQEMITTRVTEGRAVKHREEARGALQEAQLAAESARSAYRKAVESLAEVGR